MKETKEMLVDQNDDGKSSDKINVRLSLMFREPKEEKAS